MPKIRTRRATAKRFKLTASGRLRRRKANKGHLLTRKTRKRKRNLRMPALVDSVDEGKIRRQLGLR
jgi:large subunit ribosomal protein L35